MLNDREHRIVNGVCNKLHRLLAFDIYNTSAMMDLEADAELARICDAVHHDGDEIIVAFGKNERVIRIRVDMVDREYMTMSEAKAEAIDGIPEIEDFLKGE